MLLTMPATRTRGTKNQGTTRERILDAALELFVERGATGTTVSDIERAVGLAAGTGSFYRHFRSKEDVLVVAVERAVTRMAEEVGVARAAVADIDDPAERRVGDYEALLDAMRRFEPLARLVVAERERFPELQRAFTESVGAATWDFGWDEDPARAIAVAALTGYNSLVLLDAEPYRHIASADFIAALIEVTTRPEATTHARKR
jgi:AcrR family transcriptional regulator